MRRVNDFSAYVWALHGITIKHINISNTVAAPPSLGLQGPGAGTSVVVNLHLERRWLATKVPSLKLRQPIPNCQEKMCVLYIYNYVYIYITCVCVNSTQGVPEEWVKLAPKKAFTPCDVKRGRRFHVPAGLVMITCFSSRLFQVQIGWWSCCFFIPLRTSPTWI